MSDPCIICVAITGSLPSKADNPAVPITLAEQIESTHEAFEAGAAIVHCHVRDDQGRASSDPDRFAGLKQGIEKRCPGMSRLSVGSNNFPTRVYENPPDLVDRLAPSNAALVRRTAGICAQYGRPVATWQQARAILGLRAA